MWCVGYSHRTDIFRHIFLNKDYIFMQCKFLCLLNKICFLGGLNWSLTSLTAWFFAVPCAVWSTLARISPSQMIAPMTCVPGRGANHTRRSYLDSPIVYLRQEWTPSIYRIWTSYVSCCFNCCQQKQLILGSTHCQNASPHLHTF